MFNQITKKTCELVLTDGVYLEKNVSFGEKHTWNLNPDLDWAVLNGSKCQSFLHNVDIWILSQHLITALL